MQGKYQEKVNAPSIAATALGQVVPVGVGLNLRVALPEHIPEALLQQQALEGLPLFRREARRLQVPAAHPWHERNQSV